jgi:hypothetical protein
MSYDEREYIMKNPKHHIIPRYRCKELGIDPDFEDNYAYPIREQHGLIHWGYYCHDLSPLLEVCNPPQYVIDLIPLGDKRDMWAAQITAKGELDEIDMSRENNPMWKGGISLDKKAYDREYQQTPKYKAYDKKRNATPERKAYMKEYEQTPEYKAYKKEYHQTPEYKANEKKRNATPERKAYKKGWYLRKKAETQGVGTLEAHMK